MENESYRTISGIVHAIHALVPSLDRQDSIKLCYSILIEYILEHRNGIETTVRSTSNNNKRL
jgi:hypothetical protein